MDSTYPFLGTVKFWIHYFLKTIIIGPAYPLRGGIANFNESLCKELNNNGKTICLTTHYLEEAEYLCDYITIINNGKILKSDTKNNLINLIGKKTVKFSLNCQIKKVPQAFNKYNPILNANILSLTYDKNLIKLKSILDELNSHKITFDEINTYESNLEDIFIDLIKKND